MRGGPVPHHPGGPGPGGGAASSRDGARSHRRARSPPAESPPSQPPAGASWLLPAALAAGQRAPGPSPLGANRWPNPNPHIPACTGAGRYGGRAATWGRPYPGIPVGIGRDLGAALVAGRSPLLQPSPASLRPRGAAASSRDGARSHRRLAPSEPHRRPAQPPAGASLLLPAALAAGQRPTAPPPAAEAPAHPRPAIPPGASYWNSGTHPACAASRSSTSWVICSGSSSAAVCGSSRAAW